MRTIAVWRLLEKSNQVHFNGDNHFREGRGDRVSYGTQLSHEKRRNIHNHASTSRVAVGSKNVNNDSIDGRSANVNQNKKEIAHFFGIFYEEAVFLKNAT